MFKLQNPLSFYKVDALLVSSVPNIIYVTGYSGFSSEEREGYLLITKSKQYILTDGRYSEAIKKHAKDSELIEISSQNSYQKAFASLSNKLKIKVLGIEMENITVSEYSVLKKCFKKIHPIALSQERVIKKANEVDAIEKACLLGDKAFEFILKKIKSGISEKELGFELEFFIKKNGANLSFSPIVAFGKNSSMPHHQTSNQPLASSNQIILLDFGIKLNNYCSDMTRTVFFGKANAEFKKMYQTVLDAQQKAIQQLNNCTIEQLSKGVKANKLDQVARDHIVSQGYPSIPHSLGHGVGLEVHEAPRLSPHSKDELKVGMVFSIEPGIYLPNFGGVRIEDLFLVEKNNIRVLTKSSQELIEL